MNSMPGHVKIRTKPTIELLLTYYDAMLREETPARIAAILGIRQDTLKGWETKHKEFVIAKKMAEEIRGKEGTFSSYIYKHLSPEVKEIWDDIVFWESHGNANERIQEILSGRPKRIRQELFIHALISSSFDVSEACRLSLVTRGQISDWSTNDLHFGQMMEEIEWHKKNYFEGRLVKLVDQGHPLAILHVNKTLNADRGYHEKYHIHHTGNAGGSLSAGGFNIDELDLDLATRKKILAAVRQKTEEQEMRHLKAVEA